MVVEQSIQVCPSLRYASCADRCFSLTTLHREYAALMGLPYYDLCETILKARLAKPAWVDDADIRRMMASYGLNEPQAKAILSALETEGFSLIQGYVIFRYLLFTMLKSSSEDRLERVKRPPYADLYRRS